MVAVATRTRSAASEASVPARSLATTSIVRASEFGATRAWGSDLNWVIVWPEAGGFRHAADTGLAETAIKIDTHSICTSRLVRITQLQLFVSDRNLLALNVHETTRRINCASLLGLIERQRCVIPLGLI